MSRLKKYEEYLGKLHHYCLAIDVTLEYRNEEGDGAYMPSRRKIVIDKDLSPEEEIATLLHEIGHATDDALESGTPYFKRLCKAYNAFYKTRVTKKQKELVYETEVRAWEYGRGIAKTLKIPLGKWYNKIRDEALEDYKKA